MIKNWIIQTSSKKLIQGHQKKIKFEIELKKSNWIYI